MGADWSGILRSPRPFQALLSQNHQQLLIVCKLINITAGQARNPRLQPGLANCNMVGRPGKGLQQTAAAGPKRSGVKARRETVRD